MRYLLLPVLVLTACLPQLPEVEDAPPDAGTPPVEIRPPMPSQQTYSARGLYTYPNPLSEVPDGAFSRADEAVIRRPGIVETRRGFKPAAGTLGAAGDRFRSLSDLTGTLVGHTSANTVAFYDADPGSWTAISGTYTPPDSRRMRFLRSAKSLYFTTTTGVKRIDEVGGAAMDAGVPQAIGGTVALNAAASGFLPINSQTAYRFVWGYRNVNDRVILGAPSGRVSITNPSAAASGKNVDLVVRLPSWVTADHFLQVYRADTSATDAIPAGDDMGLVYEAYPTSAELASFTMAFTDIQPEELKGAPLYSSPNAGVPGSEKFQPPVCTDLAEYKERMWCSATIQRQRLLLTLLSVDATSGGMQDGDIVAIEYDTIGGEEQFTAATAYNETFRTFQRYTSGTASQNVANTALSLIRLINALSTRFTAYYVSGEFDSPGQILIERSTLGADSFAVKGVFGGPYFAPAIPWVFETIQLSRVGTTVTATLAVTHRLRVGQTVTQFTPGSANFPAGAKTVTSVPSSTTFTYTEAGAAITEVTANTWETNSEPVRSDPSNAPNGLAYSEYGEPDAIPLSNYLSVGSANYKVLRVVPLGDTLFIFKEDGTYMLTGDSPETFNVRAYPTPAKLLAPDSVVVLGNSIYALTDQGVMPFSESSAQVVSRPIESTLRSLYAGGAGLQATVAAQAFGVAYETEREYWLFMPQSQFDTYAQQAFVYNYSTQAWTRWAFPAHSGYVLPGSDLAYLGRYDANSVRVERKTLTVADYQDSDAIPIPMVVDWVVRIGDSPATYKGWQKVTVMAETPTLTQTTLCLSTEVTRPVADPYCGFMPFDGLPYVQTYVPEETQRSQTLTVSVAGGESGKRFALTGLSIDYTPSSTKLR